MEIRFLKDPDSLLAHCYEQHNVTEREAIQVVRRPIERYKGDKGALVAQGQTDAGRYLRIIYREYPDHIFVITGYDVRGKAKQALKRRRRHK